MRYKVRDYKQRIWTMFMGPYEEEWKDSMGVVNNSDAAIAKRLGIGSGTVTVFLCKVMNYRYDYLDRLRSEGLDEDSIKKKIDEFDSNIGDFV